MPNSKYLYHLTEKQSLPSILQNGLIPKIGERSQMVGETKPYIYLCERKALPYWKIILGLTTAVRVKISDLTSDCIEKFNYGLYEEYKYSVAIPSRSLSKTYTPKPSTKHNVDLCKSYIDTLDYLVLTTIRCYEEKNTEKKSDILAYLQDIYPSTLCVINKLDYSQMSTDEKRTILEEIGESGEYTFLDNFKNTGLKLYQQIMNYEDDKLKPQIKLLNEYIIHNFKECLDLNTGGWTG